MNIIVNRINEAHGHTDNKLLNAVNGKSALENYIAARYTVSNTVRLLLYKEQLEQEEKAIADDIVKIVLDTIKGI